MNESESDSSTNATEIQQKASPYKKWLRHNWEQSEHGKLCLAFFESFQAYKRYCETHASTELTRYGRLGDVLEYDEYKLAEEGLRIGERIKQERDERLQRNLEKAQKAARCQHVFLNGDVCSAPRVRGTKLCRMHGRLEEAQAVKLDLGPMEDPDSIQVGIKKLQVAIIDGKLDARQIGHLAYTIQLAAWNVMRTTAVKEEKNT